MSATIINCPSDEDPRFTAQAETTLTRLTQSEIHLYGSSRLGMWKPDRIVKQTFSYDDCITETRPPFEAVHTTRRVTEDRTPPPHDGINFVFIRGEKRYELTNHLGNVLAVVSDRKIAIAESETSIVIDYFEADIYSLTDYQPFGMDVPERSWAAATDDYRYGFNGKENDVEWDAQDYGMRMYNPALARLPPLPAPDPVPGGSLRLGRSPAARRPALDADLARPARAAPNRPACGITPPRRTL